MKRMHVHVSVDNVAESTRFYSAMLGQQPTVTKADYTKWQVEDPRLNLSISARGKRDVGLDHLGIQAETSAELDQLYRRLADASYMTFEETGAKCCYAESDKHWATDPSGVVWEMFQTMGEVATYGDDRGISATRKPGPALQECSASCGC